MFGSRPAAAERLFCVVLMLTTAAPCFSTSARKYRFNMCTLDSWLLFDGARRLLQSRGRRLLFDRVRDLHERCRRRFSQHGNGVVPLLARIDIDSALLPERGPPVLAERRLDEDRDRRKTVREDDLRDR